MDDFDQVPDAQEPAEPAGGEPQEQVKDPDTGQMIPKARFDQVYPWMKELKEFGKTPSEIRQQLQTFREWQKQVDEHKRQQNLSPDEKSEAAKVAQIRKELEKIYPEIADVKTLRELKAEIEALKNGNNESKTVANMEKASAKFTDTLKSNKIDPKFQPKIEEYIFSQMTEEERQEFMNTGNLSVPERILKNELESGLLSAFKAKSTLPTPPIRHTQGGTPPPGKQKAPSTLQDAEAAAWSMLEASKG